MLLDYEVAHNYADASCIESNYSPSAAPQTTKRKKPLHLSAFKRATTPRPVETGLYFCDDGCIFVVVLKDVSAENANETHIHRWPCRICKRTYNRTLNPPRYAQGGVY